MGSAWSFYAHKGMWACLGRPPGPASEQWTAESECRGPVGLLLKSCEECHLAVSENWELHSCE
eukprot:3339534-Alexandrium_andersonii.AAC.1